MKRYLAPGLSFVRKWEGGREGGREGEGKGGGWSRDRVL